MRAFKRVNRRGFTLVELMIVVAIIGVLAALAIYGVRKYLATAKSAEAKNTIGAINRASVAGYERENMVSEIVKAGGTSASSSHTLCKSATAPVPATTPANNKYQPNPTDGQDYNVGDQTTSWKCLKFGMTEPQYYQYQYEKGAATLTTNTGLAIPATGWAAEAKGDLDGNGIFSQFMVGGDIVSGQPVTTTTIATFNPEE